VKEHGKGTPATTILIMYRNLRNQALKVPKTSNVVDASDLNLTIQEFPTHT